MVWDDSAVITSGLAELVEELRSEGEAYFGEQFLELLLEGAPLAVELLHLLLQLTVLLKDPSVLLQQHRVLPVLSPHVLLLLSVLHSRYYMHHQLTRTFPCHSLKFRVFKMRVGCLK